MVRDEQAVFVGTSFVCLALISRTIGTSRPGPNKQMTSRQYCLLNRPTTMRQCQIVDVSDNVVRGICKVNQRILKVVSDIHVSGTSHFLDAVWICRHHYHVGNVFRATKSSGITVPLAATFIHMGREAGRKKV